MKQIRETNTVCFYLYVKSKKEKKKMNDYNNRNRLIDIKNKLVISGETSEGRGNMEED